MLKRILLISFLFIPIGILTGYLIDRLQYKRMKKYNEQMLNEIKQSMEDLESLEGQLDSLQGQTLPFDTIENTDL